MISFFYSCGLPTIFVYCEHLLEVPTILLAIWPRLHLGMPSVLRFYYPSHEKSLSILILSYTFLSPLMGKALGLSLPISLAGIKWSQPVCYLFWVKMPPQQSTFQKRPWLDTKNRTFSFFHQTTSFVIPLTIGPSPLHWLGIGWWCFSHSMVFLLLHTLSSFFSMQFLPLLFDFISFCSLLRLRLSTRGRPLWETAWAC